MNVWILEQDSGRTMFFKSIKDFPMDEILVSGFLTAKLMFDGETDKRHYKYFKKKYDFDN